MQYSTALRGTSTKRSPLPDLPWNGLLQFLKVDGEFSLKAYRADFIMFQKLFLPFVKKQGKILVMTKFYRGSSLLRENIYRLDNSRTLLKIVLPKIFASPWSSICCKIETDIFLSEHVPYFASKFNFIYLKNPLHEFNRNMTWDTRISNKQCILY